MTDALVEFQSAWKCLESHEQIRIVQLLVERVVYDGIAGDVDSTLRPNGIRALANELVNREEVAV